MAISLFQLLNSLQQTCPVRCLKQCNLAVAIDQAALWPPENIPSESVLYITEKLPVSAGGGLSRLSFVLLDTGDVPMEVLSKFPGNLFQSIMRVPTQQYLSTLSRQLETLSCTLDSASGREPFLHTDLNSVQALITDASILMENPVLLTSGNHKMIAYSPSVDFLPSNWRDPIHEDFLSLSTFSGPAWRYKSIASSEQGRPILVEESETQSYPYLLKVITHKGQILGHLVVVGLFRPFDQYVLHITELLSRLLYHNLLSQIKLSDSPMGLSSLLSDFMGNPGMSQNTIRRLLAPYAWSPGPFFYVMCALPATGNNTAQPPLCFPMQAKDRFLVHRNFPVLIISREEPFQSFREDNPQLYAYIQENHVFVGLSRCFDHLSGLSDAFEQARFALEYGRKLQPQTVIMFDYEEMWIYDLFRAYQLQPDRLRAFCMPAVADLIDYDDKHSGTLVPTLVTYLANNRHLVATAKALFLHRNTVKYRLERCHEILRLDLSQASVATNVQLSLQIMRYLQTLEDGDLIIDREQHL